MESLYFARSGGLALILTALCLSHVAAQHNVASFEEQVQGTPCMVYGNRDLDTLREYVLKVWPVTPECETADGRVGKTICKNDDRETYPGGVTWSCPPTEPLVTAGSVNPKFMIVSVVYAPPGSKDCEQYGQVSYGSGNTMGTTTSVSSSLSSGTNVGVSAKGGAMGNSVEASASFGYSESESESGSISVTKAENYNLTVPAPCKDGIDHDFDQVFVLLGPEVELAFNQPEGCATCEEGVTWALVPDVGTTYAFYAGELKGTTPMRPNSQASIEAHGLTEEDLQTILNADPLAFQPGESTEIPDPARFSRLKDMFQYAPPIPGASPIRQEYSMVSDHAEARDVSTSESYNVGLSISASAGFTDLVSATLSVSQTWTWTNSNSEAYSTSHSNSASVIVPTPSRDYTGPGAISVYYDTLFRTYAFVSAR